MISLNTDTCVPYDVDIKPLEDGSFIIVADQADVPLGCYVPAMLNWYLTSAQAETLYRKLGEKLNLHYVASSNKSAGEK